MGISSHAHFESDRHIWRKQWLVYAPRWGNSPEVVLNEVDVPSRGGTGCAYGWRPDSGGYYFVDVSNVGLFNIGPGPIRVLLTEPRPYPVPWLMLGELTLAGALGYRFWRRRR